MNVLIITGGVSSERKISLISARMVKNALKTNGHSVRLFDFNQGFEKLKRILQQFDIIFPVMHGKEGEDGMLYRFLKNSQKPYIGSDPKGAKIAFDKILFKKYSDRKHIPTAEWKIVGNRRDIVQFGFPCVLKAAVGGSSHEVALLYSKKDMENTHAKKILELPSPLFVERLLEGTEITVGILLGKALPVLEIVPPKNGWFNYKNKYSGGTKEIPFAPSVSQTLQRKAQSIALQIHKDLKLGSFSRTDLIVKNGVPYVLEINTPGGVGLTTKSLLPKAAEAAKISFEAMIERILESAINYGNV